MVHLISSQVESSESIPGQPGRTKAFEHQSTNVRLISWSQRCNIMQRFSVSDLKEQ